MTSYFKSSKKLLITSIVGAIILTVTGCGGDSKENDEPQISTVTQITSTLSGEQEVPSVLSTNATGTSTIFVDETTGDISGFVVADDLSGDIAAAHIHQAAAGQNGAVIIGLEQDADNSNKYNVPEGSQLTDEQLASLLTGGTYVNVHTAAYPSGELRGQISPSGFKLSVNQLAGVYEVPAVDTNASGTSYISYNSGSTELSINVVTSGVTATAAHMHQAFAGNNGPVIAGLTQDADDLSLWSSKAELSADEFAAFKSGATYINVHSEAAPSGEIRAQVTPADISVVMTTLSGDQEVPSVDSTASGLAFTTVNTDSGALYAILRVTGADDATVAHIHQAPAGSNGPVIIGLTQESTDATSVIWVTAAEATLDDTQIAAFQESGLYFNVHTPANASGEIRGQITTGETTSVTNVSESETAPY